MPEKSEATQALNSAQTPASLEQSDKVSEQTNQEEIGESLEGMESSDEVAPMDHQEQPWTMNIRMVGDILLHDRVEDSAHKEDDQYDFSPLFENTKELIETADLALVNQEVILGGEELKVSGYPNFNAPYTVGDALVEAGFDVICHATNHALDRNAKGVLNCLAYWEEKHPEIAVLGIHEKDEKSYEIIEKEGVKIALLNYTYGTNGIALPSDMPYAVDLLSEEKVTWDLKEARELADFVIVCPHWGTEYRLEPDTMQKKWTKIFYDNGVDLVLGTHPHVIEPMEMISGEEQDREMLVYYSLGNFVNWTSGTGTGTANRMIGGMADVTLEKNEKDEVVIKEYGIIPLVAHVEEGVGKVTTYPLSAYNEEMAMQNEIRKQDSDFSFDYALKLCYDIWEEF